MKKLLMCALLLVFTLAPSTALASGNALVIRDSAGNILLTCEDVERAYATAMQSFSGGPMVPIVAIYFTPEGTVRFAYATAENLHRMLHIYVNDERVASPIVQSVISDGTSVISGGFTIETARDLANAINGTPPQEPRPQPWFNRFIAFLLHLFR